MRRHKATFRMHRCFIYGKHLPSTCIHAYLPLHFPLFLIAALYEIEFSDTGTHIEVAITAARSQCHLQHSGLEKRYI